MYHKFTESQIREVFAISNSSSEVCQYLKLKKNYPSTVKRYAKKYNINIEHFQRSNKVQKEPKICEYCKQKYIPKSNYNRQRFCSYSCSSKAEPRRVRIITLCINCKEKETKGYNKFCSKQCQQEYHFNSELTRFNSGTIRCRPTIRKIISKIKGYKCNVCKISNWNNKNITLQVNHIDGNCTNNFPDNLELICPNCHSQTDTFGARNKGSGRKMRGLPLHY